MKRNLIQSFIVAGMCAAVFFASSSMLSAQSKKDRNQANLYIADADRAFSQKNYREAADKFGQALALVPTNPNVHYRKGFAHFYLKENDQALTEFGLALTQGFKPPLEVYKVRYYLYFDKKDYDAALSDVQKGLQLSPNDGDLLRAAGQIYRERKSYPEALAAFQRAAKSAPTDANIDYNIALVYSAMGDSLNQQAYAEKALSKGTQFVGDAYFLLADARKKQRNFVGAIDAYKRSISAKPDRHEAYGLLADLLRNENRFTEAIDVMKQGMRAFPNDGEFYGEISPLYSYAGRKDDAVQSALAGTQISPQRAEGFTNLCRAYNDVEQYQQAIGACNNALRLKPGDGETNFYLGRAYNLSGKTVEATKYYRLAATGLADYTSTSPDDAMGWYLLGNAYFADTQRDKAIEAYTKCLELAPHFARAVSNLGLTYVAKKNKSAATEQYNKLVALDKPLADKLKAEIDKL